MVSTSCSARPVAVNTRRATVNKPAVVNAYNHSVNAVADLGFEKGGFSLWAEPGAPYVTAGALAASSRGLEIFEKWML